jgi:hypothetical protein
MAGLGVTGNSLSGIERPLPGPLQSHARIAACVSTPSTTAKTLATAVKSTPKRRRIGGCNASAPRQSPGEFQVIGCAPQTAATPRLSTFSSINPSAGPFTQAARPGKIKNRVHDMYQNAAHGPTI